MVTSQTFKQHTRTRIHTQKHFMLSHFIYNNLNMTRIESRPVPDRTWEYRFLIDFEGNLADGAVKNALRGLRDEARNLRILGNY